MIAYIRGMSGSKSLVAARYLPRGGNITEGVTEMYINSTYHWLPLQDTEFSLGVVIPVSVKNEVLNSLEIPVGRYICLFIALPACLIDCLSDRLAYWLFECWIV